MCSVLVFYILIWELYEFTCSLILCKESIDYWLAWQWWKQGPALWFLVKALDIGGILHSIVVFLLEHLGTTTSVSNLTRGDYCAPVTWWFGESDADVSASWAWRSLSVICKECCFSSAGAHWVQLNQVFPSPLSLTACRVLSMMRKGPLNLG